MKKMCGFIKEHKFCSLVMAPLVLFLAFLVLGWPMMFLTGFSRPNKATEWYASVFFLLFFFIVLCYPLVLTACNLYFIIKRNSSPFQKAVSGWTETATIVFGFLLSWLYVTEATEIIFADWPQVLSNRQVHSPIATWTFTTIAVMAAAGILGYMVLRLRPLKDTPPLAAVLSMSAMYIGCLMCVLWTIQTCVPGRGGIYLYLFPVNCILIAIKVIRNLLGQWQEQHEEMGENARETDCGRMDALLQDSRNWPWLAFLFMLPMLGILIMVLTLFGQKPDSVIKAWTETSQWNLSRRVSPQNLVYDEHYLCTVAAGGHPAVVRPTRMGVRHGHPVIVNRQLCVANAFEQILMERVPAVHGLIRRIYDRYGFPLARHIKAPLAADMVYVLMKPLEWMFLAVIYLCDVRPENRIALQYIEFPEHFTDLF